jgi:hypothetical protein
LFLAKFHFAHSCLALDFSVEKSFRRSIFSPVPARIQLLAASVLSVFASFAPALAAQVDPNTPRGRFVELHSCELFAGSCIVSAEANVTGNYVLRAWQFDHGAIAGVPLQGLSVALLESGEQNLAVPENAATSAVVYLPPSLTPAQRAALLAWAGQNTRAKLTGTRVIPLQMAFSGDRVTFSAGHDIAFDADRPPPCDNLASCGEMLWYQPRVAATSFVVDQLDRSRIVEPLLTLTWMDHGRRTLFAGRFGDPEPSVPAICGAPQTASL